MYFAYILECADQTLYVGSTNDLDKRLFQHNNAKCGAHYTKIRRPVVLKYHEEFETYAEARKREGELKGLKREEKLELTKTGKKISAFTEKVYHVVQAIPKGKVLTYKQVAEKAGQPKAYRAVGNILNKNHDPLIPCHRVIRSNGKIGGYNRGTDAKRKKLKQEGYLN